jgi:hypothetical protein
VVPEHRGRLNTNALAERSVHDWRGVARRMLFNRDPRMAKAKTKKKDEWFKRWFGTIGSEGRYGEQLNTIKPSSSHYENEGCS